MRSLFLSENLRDHLASLDVVRLLVLSDSHRQIAPMRRICSHLDHIDLVIHLGDHEQDLKAVAEQTSWPWIAVAGNCDGMRSLLPSRLLLSAGGCRILAVHGHLQGVKQGLDRLGAYAADKSVSADLVLYGHTHIAGNWQSEIDGRRIQLLNPGSCAIAPGPKSASALLISIQNRQIAHEFLLDQPESPMV